VLRSLWLLELFRNYIAFYGVDDPFEIILHITYYTNEQR
jgi:hypothetical protein